MNHSKAGSDCIQHVYAFVQVDPGSPLLIEECLACHHRTGQIRLNPGSSNFRNALEYAKLAKEHE